MGTAEIIPGVSGSTLALAMGIYERFIGFLNNISELAKISLLITFNKRKVSDFKKKFKESDMTFGLTLVGGMFLAVVLLSHIVTILLEDYRSPTYGYFFGLVFASAFIPWNKIEKKTLLTYGLFAFSTAMTYYLLGLTEGQDLSNPSILLLFIGGVVGVSGLLLPGVSGSFVLLIIGIYEYIINSVKSVSNGDLNSDLFVRISVFIFGLATGLIFFVRLLRYLLKNFHGPVFAVLTGIMIGSLRVLIAAGDLANHSPSYEVIVFMIIGACTLLVIQRLNK